MTRVITEPSTGSALSSAVIRNQLQLLENEIGGVLYYTATGTINGSNQVFTVTAEPTAVIADGTTLFEGLGYTYAALSITLDNPPISFVRYTL